jgi:hypothetical protein
MHTMRIDDAVLYERFLEARLEAVQLTDSYRQTATDDPGRGMLWDNVVRQTEVARGLLESWLGTVSTSGTPEGTHSGTLGETLSPPA